MNSLFSLLKLVRLQNLIIIAICHYFIRYAFTKTFLPFPVLNDLHFFFFVLTTISIAAAGYIINDIYDIKTDEINKNGKIIINKEIKYRTAIIFYIFLNVFAILLGTYLAFIIDRILYSLVFLYCIIFLWLYSKSMKKSFLIGNIHISILSSLVLINTALFDIIPNINFKGNESGYMILKIILLYSLFSFLITLVREFVKDIEDKVGDIRINAKTLPIVMGEEKTKIIIFWLTFLIILMVGFWQYFQFQIISLVNIEWENKIYESVFIWGTDKFSIIYTIILQMSLLFFMFKLFYSKKKYDYYYLSQLCKIIMLIGICSMPCFTFFYLQ